MSKDLLSVIEQLSRGIELSIPYLEIASKTTHDGTGGDYKRREATRRLAILEAALTAGRQAPEKAQGEAVLEAESIMRDLYDANQHWARTEKRKAAVYRFRQFQAKNYDRLNLDVSNVKQPQMEMKKYPCNKCAGTGREEHYNLKTSDMEYEQCSECAGTGETIQSPDTEAQSGCDICGDDCVLNHPQATEPAPINKKS